jgi:hypothetical protein
MFARCPVKTHSPSPKGGVLEVKTAARPIPVYVDGKLDAHVMGGKYVGLNAAPEEDRVPLGERRQRWRYRDRGVEAGVTCYFIGGETGPVKIGYTRNLQRRLRDMQLHSPLPLSALASTGGGCFAEAEYHERFAAHRLHGEWFERHPDILAEIARLNQEPTA